MKISESSNHDGKTSEKNLFISLNNYWEWKKTLYNKGIQTIGLPALHWMKSCCLGPHVTYVLFYFILFFCLANKERSLLHIEQSLHTSTGTNSICPWQLWPTEKPHVLVTKVYCVNLAHSFYRISGRMFEGMKNIMCKPKAAKWW